jgi:flavin reductase (DIM6/NTAB) family NADH-FMN oxidoreductase RutF
MMNPKTLHKIPYGLYIISSRKNDKLNGQIANALFQVTAEPPTVAVSINKSNLTHDYINQSKIFSASILCQDTPMPFIGTFGFKSGRTINKFNNVNYKIGKTQAPIILNHTLAYFEAQVMEIVPVGTHTIFVGKIEDAEILTNDTPMTYEYYHNIKGGISPKTAPTYSAAVDNIRKKEE